MTVLQLTALVAVAIAVAGAADTAATTAARDATAGLLRWSDAPICSVPIEIESPLSDPSAAQAYWAGACRAQSAGLPTCEVDMDEIGEVWASPHIALAPFAPAYKNNNNNNNNNNDTSSDDGEVRQPSLMLFLPGTGGMPRQYGRVMRAAAAAGHHALVLSFMSRPLADEDANAHCAALGDGADACMARLHETAVFARTARPVVALDSADADANAEARADALWAVPADMAVDRVAAEAVGAAGWAALFLDQVGALRWGRVVIAGHSQGAGHAAYISARLGVRAVLVGGPQDEALGWASDNNISSCLSPTSTMTSSTASSTAAKRPRRVALIHEHEQFGARPLKNDAGVRPGLLERNLARLGLRAPCKRDSAPLQPGCDIVVSKKGSNCRSRRGLHAGLAYDRCSPRSMDRVWSSLFDVVR